MPPKQKMGSITHNSAEVNRGSNRGGMLSKLRGSYKSSRSVVSKSTGASTQSSLPQAKGKGQTSRSFTHGSSSVASSTRGVPTSITALVDAPSVLTDESSQYYQNQQDFRPPPAQPRRRASMTHGTTDAASRALGNLNVGGAPPDNSRVPMERPMSSAISGSGSNSADCFEPRDHRIQSRGEAGQDPRDRWAGAAGEPGHNPGGEWGGRQQHDMVQVNNAGYNNYTVDHGYDGYGDGGDGGDYYDESGGGIFDDSYMRNYSTSVSAQQPPPPNAGYNRSHSSADNTPHLHNRRSSDLSHDSYRTAPPKLGRQPSRQHFEGADPRLNQQPYRRPSEFSEESDPRTNRRPSAEADPRTNRRPSVETDPRMGHRNPPSGNGGRYGNKSPSDPGRNSTDNVHTRRRSTTDRHNPGVQAQTACHKPARNNIVNNTGRDSGNKSPGPSSGSGSGSGRNNPSWFTEHHSSSTNEIQNGKLRLDKMNNNRSHSNQDDDDDRTMATMATKDQALRPSAMLKAKEKHNPDGIVTIIFTDVQGSTSLWESCPSDMKKAVDIHDTIMRQCYANHSGYEISTEGDAFNLAFQHPVDALAFALQAQLKLYKADWPEGILNHPDGKEEKALKFRGFRVRFGIHQGPTKSRVHEMTGRDIYSGEGVKVAKAVEG